MRQCIILLIHDSLVDFILYAFFSKDVVDLTLLGPILCLYPCSALPVADRREINVVEHKRISR